MQVIKNADFEIRDLPVDEKGRSINVESISIKKQGGLIAFHITHDGGNATFTFSKETEDNILTEIWNKLVELGKEGHLYNE